MTISLRDGKPIVTHRLFHPRGDDHVGTLLDVPYLRVLDDGGFEWGHMNGMRPRTMVVAYTARLDASGALTGYQMPKGVSMPPSARQFAGRRTPFTLHRVSD